MPYRSEARHKSPEWAEIITIVRERIEHDSVLIRQMADIQMRYEGEYVMPVLADNPDLNLPPMSPAIVTDAIENIGNRSSSVFPGFNTPQLRNQDKGVGSKEWAGIRRETLQSTWGESKGKLVLRRACKQLTGYDSTSFVIQPHYDKRDIERDGVRIIVRSPLTTYPDNRENDDFSTPESVGFIYERSSSWLRRKHPHLTDAAGGPLSHNDERKWRLLEWHDEYNMILGLMNPIDSTDETWDPQDYPAENIEIMCWENRLSTGPPVVCPTRINLDRLGSRLSHITGVSDLMSQLMLLEILATEEQIYPDKYVVGLQGQTPSVISHGGQWQAGRTGNINMLKNVATIGSLSTPPPQQTGEMLDTLERIGRQHSKDVPTFRGETYGSLRTGKGIDSMMGASVDPVIQEIHETLEVALTEVNDVVLQTWRDHWSGRTFSLYSGSATNLHEFTLKPDMHIDTTRNVVSYAIPGADIQAVTVQLGQLLATKGMSLHSFRTRHPWIDDPEMEGRLTDEEAIEEALLTGILQQVSSGQMPVTYAAKIEKYRKTEPDIISAILKADEEVAAEQAKLQEEQPPPTDPAAMPGLAGGPEMLTPPGLPPESGMPTGGGGALPPGAEMPAIGPSPDQAGLKQLINAVTAGQSMVTA